VKVAYDNIDNKGRYDDDGDDDDDDDDDAVCTVRWRNRTNTHSFDGQQHWGVASAEACLHYCVVTTTCVAVDIDYKYLPAHCWVHQDPARLYYTAPIFNVVQYRVVSRHCRDGTFAVLSTLMIQQKRTIQCMSFREADSYGPKEPFAHWRQGGQISSKPHFWGVIGRF